MTKIKQYSKYFVSNITTALQYFFNKRNYILVDGFPHTKNFGDALNTPLIEFLSGKKVLPSKNISRVIFGIFKFQNYAVIGSILQWIKRDSEIWGAGFIMENQTIINPSKIYAVRGPKTRDIYLKNNINCPEIYGDPALLLPLLYNPKIKKKYKLGIIPHYYDYTNLWVENLRKRSDVLIINLMVRYDYQRVINQMLQCEKILSSSLHGVIIADAYQIPNRQIQLSNKVVGAEFKFTDYYLSVGRDPKKAIIPMDVSWEDIDYNTNIQIDLRKLVDVCPFVQPNIKIDLLSKLNNRIEFSHLAKTKE